MLEASFATTLDVLGRFFLTEALRFNSQADKSTAQKDMIWSGYVSYYMEYIYIYLYI